jgi:ankyrin repeat protein
MRAFTYIGWFLPLLVLVVLAPFRVFAKPSELNKRLADAVEYRYSIAHVETLLKEGADPNTKFRHNSFRGVSPFILSVSEGRLDVAKLLIEYGAIFEPDAISVSKWVGLAGRSMAINGHRHYLHYLPAIDFILGLNIPIDLKDKDGETFFIKAVSAGNKAMAQAMIDRNADINTIVPSRGTALHIAVEREDIEMLNFLLEQGANFALEDEYHQSPLALAVRLGAVEEMSCLEKRGATTSFREVLQVSSNYDNDRGLRALLERGMTIDKSSLAQLISRNKLKLVLLALKNPTIAIDEDTVLGLMRLRDETKYSNDLKENFDHQDYQLLLSSIASKVVNSDNVRHLFFDAVSYGNETALKILLQHGANPNWQSEHGQNVLSLAAGRGNLATVEALVSNGAKLEATSGLGKTTALFEAVLHEKSEIVDFLLGNGANPGFKDLQGSTPLQFAIDRGSVAVIDAFAKHGVQGADSEDAYREAFVSAPISEKFQTFRHVLSKIKDVNVKGKNFTTALTNAAIFNRTAFIRTLVERGADLELPKGACKAVPRHHEEAVTRNGCGLAEPDLSLCNTALMAASELGHISVVKLLLQAGAKVDWQSPNHGLTALMLAAEHGEDKVVQYLLKQGADRYLKDYQGKMALDYARDSKMTKTARLLATK